MPASARLEAALAAWPDTIVPAGHGRAFRPTIASRSVGMDGSCGTVYHAASHGTRRSR